MPIVKVGDINMYYEIYGEGEPFVMIFGAGGSLDNYYPCIPAYSREYQLVLFDYRGVGQTDAPDIPYTWEMLAADLAGLFDAIGVESAHIFGTSMGGMQAQIFAILYPAKVRNLILAATSCLGPESGFTGTPSPEVIQILQSAPATPEGQLTALCRAVTSDNFVDNNPDKVKQFIELHMKHPAPPVGIKRIGELAQSVSSYTYIYDHLPEIKAPTLVIAGDKDKMIPVDNSRLIASRIPGAELVILEGMNHGFWFEALDETTQIVLDFLRQHSDK